MVKWPTLRDISHSFCGILYRRYIVITINRLSLSRIKPHQNVIWVVRKRHLQKFIAIICFSFLSDVYGWTKRNEKLVYSLLLLQSFWDVRWLVFPSHLNVNNIYLFLIKFTICENFYWNLNMPPAMDKSEWNIPPKMTFARVCSYFESG